MRTDITKQLKHLGKLEQGFLGGFAAALLAIGVTVLTVGAVKRLRGRALSAKTKIGIDSIPPKPVELAAQPQPEANSSQSPRLESESEMNDVMLPSQRW